MNEWMEKLERKRQTYSLRFGASIIAFAAFIALMFAFRNSMQASRDQMMVVLVILVASMLILPRRALPGSWPRPSDQEQELAMEDLRASLRKIETTAMLVRIAYLLIAAILIALIMF